jgi:hypothetical protein
MDVGCQVCGQLNPPDARACQFCGAVLAGSPIPRSTGQSRWRRPTLPASQWGEPAYALRSHGLKDPNTGMVAELLPGLFLFLGIGHIWAGQVALGILLMFGYWFVLAMLLFLTIISFGLLLCFFPFYLVVWPGVPIISAIVLQRRLQRERQQLVVASTSPHPY